MDNHKYVAKTQLTCVLYQVWTTKNLDRQPEIVTWLCVGQPFIFPYIRTLEARCVVDGKYVGENITALL